jgi:hypothetical protein
MNNAMTTTADEMAVARDAREAAAGVSFDQALAGLLVAAQAKVDAYFEKFELKNEAGVRFQGEFLAAEDPGPRGRYVRVWSHGLTYGEQNGSRRIYCFVDKKTGDVLKAETWKKPAKHARSNVFDADRGASGVTSHGGAYLK